MSNFLDRPLEDIPAHPRWLNDKFRLLKESGLAPKTVANVKTELRYALRTALGRQPRSPMPKLSGEWARLFESLKGLPLQWQLSRFIRYLCGLGINPSSVDDSHAEACRRDLEASDEVDQPYYRWRAAIRAWNRAAATVPGWPPQILNLPNQRRARWTLPEQEFQESFRDDVDACLARMGRDDPLGKAGPKRALRPSTLKLRRHQYNKLASAAVFAGTPISSITSFAQLLELKTFTAAAQYLLDRQDGRRTEALHGLIGGMLAVARHHVRVDEAHYEALREIHVALDPCEEGFREKTRQRIEQFDDDRNSARLLHLPAHLLKLAQKPGVRPRDKPILAQIAIATEMLLFAPLRVGNLAGLNLERHVRRVVVDGEEQMILTIPRSEVKNRQTTTYRIEGESLALIDAAFALYEQTDGCVFPGRNGPKATSLLSSQIKAKIRRHAKLDVTPHLFRALSGVFHMRRHPGAFEDIRVMLHDRDAQTIRESYTVYSNRHLIRHVQESVLNARCEAIDPYRKGRLRGGHHSRRPETRQHGKTGK